MHDPFTPISPPSPRVPWEDRFPKEERGATLPAGFVVPVVDMGELFGRLLAQAVYVPLNDDDRCILHLMAQNFPLREIRPHLRAAQRWAIAVRCRGIAA